jgi:transcriptional regulator with XRE-family HTH domain
MNNITVGKNIRFYRERTGLTQQDLGDLIGKTWEMISRYERGASSALSQIDKLSKALKVLPSDLLGDEKELFRNMFPRVPLFTRKPSGRGFYPAKTNVFYFCPDWILNIDPDAYAVVSEIVKIDAMDLKKKGVFFIAPNIHCSLGDPTLFLQEKRAHIARLNVIPDEDSPFTVMGRVIAHEINLYS